MSYERDKDRDTRGVGAIAALDKGSVHRYRQRIARARQNAAIDRTLAGYTFRPGGGMAQGLGMINMGAMGVGQRLRGGAGDLQLQDPSKPPTMPGGTGGGAKPPKWQLPTRLWGGSGTVLQQPLQTQTRYPTLTSGSTPVVGVIVDPVRPSTSTTPSITPSTTTPTKTKQPVIVGGGGGGGGYPVAQPASSYPGMEEPQTPDIPADGGAPGPDYKKLALIAGGALAVWYLFLRKKPGQGSGGPP